MADNSGDIIVTIDAEQVNALASSSVKSITQIISEAKDAESGVKALSERIKQMFSQLTAGGTNNPNTLNELGKLGQALGGGFSEAGLKLKAVQGQLKEFQAESVNVVASIYNAQAAAASRVSKAVNEAKIAAYQASGNSGYFNERDAGALKLRIEAQQRQVNAKSLVGGDTALDEKRLASMKTQLQAIEGIAKSDAEALKGVVAGVKELAAQEASLQKVQSGAGRFVAAEQRKAEAAAAKEALAAEKELAAQEASLQKVQSGAGRFVAAEQRKAEAAAAKEALAAEKDLEAQQKKNSDYLRSVQLTSIRRNNADDKRAANVKTPEQQAQAGIDNNFTRLGLDNGAAVFKLQAAILANYQIVNVALSTLRNSIGFIAEFEASMKELQAIAGATNTEFEALSKSFLDLSTNSRFSGTEIAQAATILAQAGLSAPQIKEAIGAITQLATATGSDLKQAVDLATTAMTVFNYNADQMGSVANIVTAALNVSKLDIDKLAQGLSYSGNIAAEAGLSLTELTTALSAMSNAGIKAGSTLGTGLREILSSLLNPTQKFESTVQRLGLTMSDVDVHSQGLFGVLKNLQAAGFSSSDALYSLGLRGGAAFTALIRQSGSLDQLERTIATTGDAAGASATQMDSLDSSWKRFSNTAGALGATITGPLVGAFKTILNTLADLMQGLREGSSVLTAMATLVGVTVTGAFLKWIVPLGLSILNINKIIPALKELGVGLTAATTLTEGLGVAINLIGKGNLVIAALGLAFSAATVAYSAFATKTETLTEKIDKTNTSISQTQGRIDGYQSTIDALNGEMDKLGDRHDRLSKNGTELQSVILELNSRFKDLGLSINANTTDVDTLIGKLGELKRQQLSNQQTDLQLQQVNNAKAREQQQQQVSGLFGAAGIKDFQKQAGITGVSVYARSNSATKPNYGAAFNQETPDAFSNQSLGDIADTLKTLGQQAPSSQVDYERVKAQLSERIGTLTKDREALSRNLTDANKGILAQVDSTIDGTSRILSQLQKTATIDASGNVISDQQQKISAALSPTGQKIDDLRQRLKNTLSNVQGQFTGTTNNLLPTNSKPLDGTGISVEDRKKNLDRVLGVYHDYAQEYNGLYTSLTEQQKKDLSLQLDAFRSAIEDIGHKANISQGELQKLEKPFIAAREKAVEAQIQNLMGQVNATTPRSTIETIPRKLKGLYGQLSSLQVGNSDGATAAEIQAKNATDLQTHLDKINGFLSKANEKFASAADTLENVPKAVDQFDRAVKDVNDNLKRSTKQADSDISLARLNIITSQSSAVGINNTDRVSNVEVQKSKDDLDRLEAQAAQTKYNANQVADQQLSKIRDEFTARQNTDNEEIKSLQTKLSDQSLSLQQINDLKKQGTELDKESNDLGNKLKDLDSHRLSIAQDQATLQEKIAAYQKKDGSLSIGQGFGLALDQFNSKEGNNRTFGTSVIDSFSTTFSSVQQEMSGFVQNITRGTTTVKNAFLDLATSILDSLAKLATNQLVSQLFSAAGSLFGGAASGGAVGGTGALDFSSGTSAASLFGPHRQGGLIRAAQGYGNPSRDSVPTLTMPGEYVLQKSAVDSLGSDFMDRLNTQGASALSAMRPLTINQGNKGDGGMVNVYVTHPDQQPIPGPKDIIAAISNDMVTGGVTKQLIKSIQMGAI